MKRGIITSHQAFFKQEALTDIARITIENISSFEQCGKAVHPVSVERIA